MTEEELRAIEARAEAATTGPSGIPALVAEVRRLREEVERTRRMRPYWYVSPRGRVRLYVGAGTVAEACLFVMGDGTVFDPATVDEYPDIPTACRAVCARLGLPYIPPPEKP